MINDKWKMLNIAQIHPNERLGNSSFLINSLRAGN